MERFAGVLFVTGLVMGAAAPLLALLGVLEPIAALDGPVGHVAGIVLGVGGILLTFGAQLAMGDAWRVGVDPEERTELVTGGPFGLVRNPIYSAMIPTVLGLALMVPNVLGNRRVPHPRDRPGAAGEAGRGALPAAGSWSTYADYAARVGRFVPGLGLLHGAR